MELHNHFSFTLLGLNPLIPVETNLKASQLYFRKLMKFLILLVEERFVNSFLTILELKTRWHAWRYMMRDGLLKSILLQCFAPRSRCLSAYFWDIYLLSGNFHRRNLLSCLLSHSLCYKPTASVKSKGSMAMVRCNNLCAAVYCLIEQYA